MWTNLAVRRARLREPIFELGGSVTDEMTLRLRRAASGLDAGRVDSVGLANRAVAEGLVDVAYATLDCSLGELLVATTKRGLVRVAFLDRENRAAVLAKLAHAVSPRVVEARAPLGAVCRELEQYLDGRRRAFDLALDWRLIGPFARQVLETTAAIPYGEVSTYGDIATAINHPRAARAAGNALARNPIPIVVPCHRVVRGGGALGGYGGGNERKRQLLELEGAA